MVMACYSEAGTCAVMRNYAAHEDIWSWKDGAFMKLRIFEVIGDQKKRPGSLELCVVRRMRLDIKHTITHVWMNIECLL